MKRKSLALIGIAAVLTVLAFSSFALAEEQTSCPTCGMNVDGSKHVDVDGKRVYVCNDNCANEVKADPKKYIAQLEKAGVTLAKVQTTCPTCGMKVDGSKHVDVDGKRVYVCNDNCAKEVKADPGKYIAQLEKEGVTIETALRPQETCPVMGGKINKKSYVDVAGKRIYVCCAGCLDTIKADADKYIKVLADRGESVETISK